MCGNRICTAVSFFRDFFPEALVFCSMVYHRNWAATVHLPLRIFSENRQLSCITESARIFPSQFYISKNCACFPAPPTRVSCSTAKKKNSAAVHLHIRIFSANRHFLHRCIFPNASFLKSHGFPPVARFSSLPPHRRNASPRTRLTNPAHPDLPALLCTAKQYAAFAHGVFSPLFRQARISRRAFPCLPHNSKKGRSCAP